MNDTDTRFTPADVTPGTPRPQKHWQSVLVMLGIVNLTWVVLLTAALWYSHTDALAGAVWLGPMVYAESAEKAGVSSMYEIGLGSRRADQGVCVWRRRTTPLVHEERRHEVIPRAVPSPSLQKGNHL